MSCCQNHFFKFALINIISLYILISIFFYIFFVIEDLNYEEIDIYIEAIEKTWNNYPILDISLTRKYGYKEIILMDLKDILFVIAPILKNLNYNTKVIVVIIN